MPASTRRALEGWRDAARRLKAIDAALRPLELTHTQFFLLHAANTLIEVSGDAVAQREIADELDLDAPTVSTVVRRLEERRLLDRDISGSDARRLRVRVTNAGQRLLDDACALLEEAAR